MEILITYNCHFIYTYDINIKYIYLDYTNLLTNVTVDSFLCYVHYLDTLLENMEMYT